MVRTTQLNDYPTRTGGSRPPAEGLPSRAVLTEAEHRIALGYVDGLIGKEIASKQGISYNTVVKHTQNIYDKTGIRHSTNALVAWFLSKNYDLDLSELRRSIEGVALLVIFLVGLASNGDLGNMARRAQPRRVEARRSHGRRNREDNETYYLS